MTELTPITFDPMQSIEKLLDKGIPAEKLGAYFDLVRKWQDDRAAETFALAITGFQGEMVPVIKRNPIYGKVKEAGPQYFACDHDDIMAVIEPFRAKYKIVITFSSAPAPNNELAVTCRIRVGRHFEETTVVVPIPVIPNADATKCRGGALAYGKKYALCAALNIRTKDDDTEHLQTGLGGLSDGQTEELNNIIERCRKAGATDEWITKFWIWIHPGSDGSKRMPEMDARDMPRAVKQLKEWLDKWEK